MKPERWRKIEELYHAALARAGEERAALLDELCGGDDELRREVETLVAAHEQEGSFIDSPAFVATPQPTEEDQAESLVGQRIGRYEVLSLLGRGGMGEVYLARDPRLGRRIALKLLPASLALEKDRLRRFEREARAASALSHPNVCTIYEVGESAEGRYYITMEYVDGETLRQRLTGRQMRLDKVLDIGVQIAAALEAAHEAGVVHRDIKPENVIVRRDGLVKILDFGLAQLIEQRLTADSDAETKAPVRTSSGVVMGTAQYMSPEQARGHKTDARTDIWSFGCVLYEMVAGHPPFEGETTSHVIVSILEHEPLPLSRLSPAVPAELQRIIKKALRKEREERFQTVKDLGLDLKALRRELEIEAGSEHAVQPPFDTQPSVSGSQVPADHLRAVHPNKLAEARPTESPSEAAPASGPLSALSITSRIKWHSRGVLLILIILVMAMAGIAFGLYKLVARRQAPIRASEHALSIRPLISSPGDEFEPAFSPDGNQIAFSWNGERGDNLDIYVKLVDVGVPLRLTTNPAPELRPVFSPDGRYIAFARELGSGFGIYLIPSLAGTERKVAEIAANPEWGASKLSFSPDGKWIAAGHQSSPDEPFSLFLFSVETGEKRKLTSPPRQYSGDMNPVFSPDGSQLAFIRSTTINVGDLYLMPASGGEPRRLTFDNLLLFGLTWAADGREIVFGSSRGLWRISVSGGTPEPLSGIGTGTFFPAISRQGNRLAYVQFDVNANIWRIEVPDSALGGSASPTKLIASTREELSPQYSPDGSKIVFASTRTSYEEIWMCNSDGSSPVQLTSFNGPPIGTPRWSPDSSSIAFDSAAAGNWDIYVVSAGGGPVRRLTTTDSNESRPSWSRDGRWVYFYSDNRGGGQVWKMPAARGEASQMTKQGGNEPMESPDGRFIYYHKTDKPDNPYGMGSIWRMPIEGGQEERIFDGVVDGFWAIGERGIYYINRNVEPRTIELYSLATGQVRKIAAVEKELRWGAPGFAISSDGRWILYSQVDQRGADIMVADNFR